ncbi:MAG TPA: putative molybdenum carrier protein [Verrucomicrobiae bacterium]|nr:putative molybdenum carrier protein [Verrucomicrobiae bacterium]
MIIERLVSGGQTGADRAALDAAIARGLPHGGWCPKGRRAEDGVIPGRYALEETPAREYLQRTEWNVRDSDGTVVFTLGVRAQGGALQTLQIAQRLGRPLLHLAKDGGGDVAQILQDFVGRHCVRVLNVAGSRESEEPGIGAWVAAVLEGALVRATFR